MTVTAPNTQTVGNSLTLTCNVTAVRGITSSVDIIWSSDGREVDGMEGVSVSSTTDNSVVYTDTYNISQLNTTDDGREYQCEVVINSISLVMAIDSVTLDVMGGCLYVTCLSSYYPTECVPLNLGLCVKLHTLHFYIPYIPCIVTSINKNKQISCEY